MWSRTRLSFKLITITLYICTKALAIGPQFLAIPIETNELVYGINPALIQTPNTSFLSGSYGNWLADMKTSSIDYNYKLKMGSAGLKLRYVGLNDIELRSERPSDEPIAKYGSNAYAIDFTYQGKLKIGTFKGVIRLLHMQLYNENAGGAAFDFIFNKSLNNNFKIGTAILNVGSISEFYKAVNELPLRFIVGASFQANLFNINNQFNAAVEKSSLVDGLIFRLGDKISFDNLDLLIGAQFSKKSASLSSGIDIKIGRYNFGYAVQIGSQSLGVPQIFSLAVNLP